MEELKLNQVIRLEKKDLTTVRGEYQATCGCGCAEFNGLDNGKESATANQNNPS